MAESLTHSRIRDILATHLKPDGYRVETEKWFDDGGIGGVGRMDICLIDEETGEEIEGEIFITNTPPRFFLVWLSGKLSRVEYSRNRAELEKKMAVWQQLSSTVREEVEEEPQRPIYRERDQYDICLQFWNLIKSGHVRTDSMRILDTVQNIFSFLYRKRHY